MPVEQLRPVAGRVLNFIIRFYEVELKDNVLNEEENAIFEDLKSVAKEFKEYVKERVRLAGEYASENQYEIYHCTTCFENSLIKEIDDFKCFVCDLVGADASEVTEVHLENKLGLCSYETAKHGGEMPQHDCPECSKNTLVPEDESYKYFICVNCSEKIDSDNLHTCSRCSTIFYDTNEEPGSACPDCWDDLMNKD